LVFFSPRKKESAFDVETGKTFSVKPSDYACELHLAHKPKYITYRAIEDALLNPLDVQILKLSHQKLKELPTEFTQFKNLEFLNLEFNLYLKLTADIGELKNLQELNLRKTFLVKMPPEIKNLTKLKKLMLGGTKLNQTDKDEIANSLPQCKNLLNLQSIGVLTMVPETGRTPIRFYE